MAKRVEGRSDRLLQCAKEEFLEMGFQEASLRVIAAKAGTTTGSIYTRFEDKNSLFHALVDDTINELLNWVESSQNRFAEKPAAEKEEEVFTYQPDQWDQLVNYIYDNWDVFRLLLCCNDIDCYAKMIHSLIEIEVDYTYRFFESTNNDAVTSGRLSPMMIHILSSSFYEGLFETVRHEMPKDEAFRYVHQLRRFFLCGWADLLKAKLE